MTKHVAFSVRIDVDGQYAHMIATPCIVDDENTANPVHGCSVGKIDYPSDYDENFGWMEGFRMSSQANCDDARRNFYGMECRYHDIYSVTLRKAESMVKQLKKVDKGLEKLSEEWGYAQTMADFIFRAAKSCGAKYIIFKCDTAKFQRCGYGYQCCEIKGEALNRLRYMEQEFTRANELETV